MASIQKQPSGKWRARYRDPAGKEHARHFARRVDAERWVRSVETAKDRGEWIDPRLGQVTFAEWAKRWEATVVDLRASTLDRDLGVVRNHLERRFGPMALAKITTSNVKAFIAEANRGRHSPATVRKIGQVLSKVMAEAVTEGLISRSPCDGVALPAEGRREMVFLTPEQVVGLVDPPTSTIGCSRRLRPTWGSGGASWQV